MTPELHPSKSKSIRYHNKTRTGCLQCKRRRIKCDEARPVCNRCTRCNHKCSFKEAFSASQTRSTKVPKLKIYSSDSTNNCSTIQETFSLSSSTTKSYCFSPYPTPSNETAMFSLSHMEILYFYGSETYATISRSPELHTIWKKHVVEIALSNDFMLSAIIAFTARHLAKLRAEKMIYYNDIASKMHDYSLKRAAAAQILPSLNAENCGPAFVFSVFTWMNALAKQRECHVEPSLQPVLSWLTLLRGVVSIWTTARPWLRQQALGALLQSPSKLANFQTTSPADPYLDRLKVLFERRNLPQETYRLYADAISTLGKEFLRSYNITGDTCLLSFLFRWPAALSEEFIILLQDENPEALVIFAHYAVLLNQGQSCWWLEGHAQEIIAGIYSKLDCYHRTLIQWPMGAISWSPL